MRNPSFIIKIPGLGRIGIAYERTGEGLFYPGGLDWRTNLSLKHFDPKQRLIEERDLGSGLVTNIGVLALCGDSQWPQTSIVTNLFKLLKYHASGKGTNAGAFTDIQLQTNSTVGGQTPVAG